MFTVQNFIAIIPQSREYKDDKVMYVIITEQKIIISLMRRDNGYDLMYSSYIVLDIANYVRIYSKYSRIQKHP